MANEGRRRAGIMSADGVRNRGSDRKGRGGSHRRNPRRVIKKIRRPKLNYNDAQKEAIAWNNNTVLISAGPGSGKTRIIVARIARLVRDGVDPKNILATTFTKKAAEEMNERLISDGVDVKQMAVQTMHAFCWRILKREKFKEWKLETDLKVDLETLIKQAVGWQGMKWKGCDVTLVEHFISTAKNSLIRPEQCRDWPVFNQDPYYRDNRYAEAYFEVEDLRIQRKMVTFDDMLIDGVELLQENMRIRDLIQSRYEYVIVDEYQDSNLAQVKLVELVGAPQWNVMCVGDVDQCHPPGTKIMVDDGWYKPIEELKDGDTIKGWNRHSQKMIGGRRVRVGKQHYSGKLAIMHVEGHRHVEMTPDHKVLVRWTNKKDRDTCVVYLMYREDRGYRIGWCQLLSNSSNTFHLRQRAKLEKAEKVWILTWTKDKTRASVLESIYSILFGIPTTPFEPVKNANHLTEEAITTIFKHVRDESVCGAKRALRNFGLDINLPLLPFPSQVVASKSDNEVKFRRHTFFPVYANNLIPGLMSVPDPDKARSWRMIEEVGYRHYDGPVYSLDVEKDHAYAADGAVVLNCIYEWRGAVPKFMIDFPQEHDAHVISMGTNYRCAPNIMGLAARCIAHNQARITKDLDANKTVDATVRLVQANDLDDEATLVADEVEALKHDGIPTGSMFVLYRTNAQSRAIEEVFCDRKIPHVVLGSTNFYQRKEVQDMLAYLKLMNDPKDHEAGSRAINRPFRYIKKEFVTEMTHICEEKRISFLDAMDEVASQQNYRVQDSCNSFARIMEKLISKYQTQQKLKENIEKMPVDAWTVGHFISHILEETNYLDYLTSNEGSDTMENSREANIGELIRSADRYYDIKKFLEFVEWQIEERKKRKKVKNAVLCMTIHRAKGLEANAVFLIGVNDGLLPHAAAEEPKEEERRLFYVGVTRAMDYLQVSHVLNLGMGNRTLEKSRFIDEAGLEEFRIQNNLTPTDTNDTVINSAGDQNENTEEIL